MEENKSEKTIDELQVSIITQINNLVVSREAAKRPSDSARRLPLLGCAKEAYRGKKTLILDLDETLVHSSFEPLMKTDIVFPIMLEGRNQYIYVSKRPGVDEFIKRMSQLFELVIFTASVSKYSDPLITLLDKSNLIEHRLYREHCILINCAFVKDLSNFGRPLSEVIIVDNCPSCYALHSANGIPIETWINNPLDNKLFELIPALELLAKQSDVRPVIKKIVKKNKIDFEEVYQFAESEKIEPIPTSNKNWAKCIPNPTFASVPKQPEESQKPLFFTHLQIAPKLRTQVNPSPVRTHKAAKFTEVFNTPNKKIHKNVFAPPSPIISPFKQPIKLPQNPRSPTKTGFSQIHFSKEETKLSTLQAPRKKDDGIIHGNTRVTRSSQKKVNPRKWKSKLSFSQCQSQGLLHTLSHARFPTEGPLVVGQHLAEPSPKPSTTYSKPKRRIEVAYAQSNSNQILIHQPTIKTNAFPSSMLSATHSKSQYYPTGTGQFHF